MRPEEIPYGPVKIVSGAHSGRIGYYDDEDREVDRQNESDESDGLDASEEDEGVPVAIVYFGDFLLARGSYIISQEFIRPVTTDDLIRRRGELHGLCGGFARMKDPDLEIDAADELSYFAELNYVESVLVDRMIAARYSNKSKGARVFISHSSKDKQQATWIAVDLRAAGHEPWLDQWSIRVGESIPQRISEGISEADFVVVLLSENALASRWVEREWQSKYQMEVDKGRIHVLPALLEPCLLPELLRAKKYADFHASYNDGLEDLLAAIDALYS